MNTERGGSEPDPPANQPGWFARVPLWARIVIPVALILGAAAIVAAVVATQPQDTTEAVESLCTSAVQERLEGRDASDIEVSRSFEVIEGADSSYQVTGTVDYVDDGGEMQHANARCIIRVEDGAMRVASVRVQG